MRNSLSPWCQVYLSEGKSEPKDALNNIYEQIFDSNFACYTEEKKLIYNYMNVWMLLSVIKSVYLHN